MRIMVFKNGKCADADGVQCTGRVSRALGESEKIINNIISLSPASKVET